MAFGLFGKLPQKRDFISVNLPNAVLNPFETWLQSAVAASRSEIGRGWENYYLVAPIWRFWLGKDILGTAATGSLMPSVDQVGRYFPLAIIYYADPGETLVPPLINPIEHWYQQIEQRLLGVLSEDNPIEVSMMLTGLMPPDYSQPVPRPMPVRAPQAVPTPVATPYEAPVAEPEPVPEPEPESAPEPPAEPEVLADAEPEAALELPAEAAGDDAGVVDSGSDWAPEPMPADKLAALQQISASSFAGDWAAMPEAKVKSVPQEPAAAPVPPVVANPLGNLWDDDAVVAEPAPLAVLSEPPRSAPAATTQPSVSAAAAPVAEAEEPAAVPVAEPDWEPPVAAPAWEPPPMEAAPPEPAFAAKISSADFKGGMFAAIEDNSSFTDALPQLMALDFANAAQGRGYWWCGPSSSGGPRVFSRAGLPDPYVFTRMLMWTGQ